MLPDQDGLLADVVGHGRAGLLQHVAQTRADNPEATRIVNVLIPHASSRNQLAACVMFGTGAYRHLASETLCVPLINVLAGTSWFTIVIAPMTDPAPIVTPGIIIQRAPIQVPASITTGARRTAPARCADVPRS